METHQNLETKGRWFLLSQLQTHLFHNFDGHRRSGMRTFVCWVRSNGRVNDSGISNKSSLLQGIQDGSVNLPDDKRSNGEITSYVFVGDDASALKNFMMKPFSQQSLTWERGVCSYRHGRVQRISKNFFLILANRWRIVFITINFELKYVENIILAALILHNILIKSPN